MAPKASEPTDEMQPLLDAEEGTSSARVVEARAGSQVSQSLTRTFDTTTELRYEATDRAQMQSDLVNMPQKVIGELDLIRVPWGQLGMEFARNSIPSILMICLMVVLMRMTPPLHFGIKPAVVIILTVLLAGFFSFAVELPQVKIGDLSSELPYSKRLLKALPLLQAIRGKKILKLSSRAEVYIFAQCLERQSNNPGAFVELVVNPESPEETRKILTVDNEEVMPSRWKCTSLYNKTHNYTEELQRIVAGEPYPTLAQVIGGWVVKDHAFRVPCFIELEPSTRWLHIKFLWEHWAIRMLLCMAMIAVVLGPVWQYLTAMRRVRLAYCRGFDDGVLPACGPDREGKTCRAKCGTFLAFAGEVGSRIGVEEIEHIWTMSLVLVAVYIFSLSYVWSCQDMLVTKFLLQMGSVPRTAQMEVMKVRKLLHDSFSPVGILQGLFRQCQALRFQIKACEPLAIDLFSGPSKIMNPWFWHVMAHVRDTNLRQATPYPIYLPTSDVEHHRDDVKGVEGDLVSWSEKMDYMSRSLLELKNLHGFSRWNSQSGSRKMFKFCVSVPVTCRESLQALETEFFTKAGPGGYAAQLDAIFNTANCQDGPGSGASEESAGFCHVMEDFRLGPLLVPAGFCLTHIACKAPDASFLSLEIGKDKDISCREAFTLLFHGKDNPNLNNSLVLDGLCVKYRWPSIMLPSAAYQKSSWLAGKETQPVDSQGLEAKMKDTFIYQFYFVFQVTPQYFDALRMTEQAADMSLFGFCEGMFDRMRRSPVREPAAPALEAIKRQSWQDCQGSQFCLVTERDKAATWSKFVHLWFRLSHIALVVAVSALFALAVPLFRRYRSGSALFPAPFTSLLACNAVVQFLCLLVYISHFSYVSARLQAVAKALTVFEQKTLASISSKGSRKRGEGLAKSEEDPFQLSIGSVRDYDPTDKAWIARWQSKEKSLLSWHLCARYMRILISPARLTSQAILVAAAAILLVMLLVDVWQGLSGAGALAINKDAIFEKIHEQTMEAIKGAVEDADYRASNITGNLVETAAATAGKALDVAGSRHLLDGGSAASWDLGGATQALLEALLPFNEAVDRVRERQLFDLGHQLERARKFVDIGKVQKVTHAQLLTICMTMLLLVYSGILLYRIAKINDKMESHENLLVQVKEDHLQRQSIRQTQSRASPLAEVGGKARESYERMLDMCIESAHANKSRFAFKLFSLAISPALLIVWVCTAVQPLVQQLSSVTPVLLEQACHWLADSKLGSTAEGGLGEFQKGMAKTILDYKAHGRDDMIYSLVCAPLIEVAKSEAEKAGSAIERGKTDGAWWTATPGHGRRLAEDEHLLSRHAVTPLVEDWWDRHPGHPEAKLALVRALLGECSRGVRSLLMAGPEAMREAVRSRRLHTAGSAAARSRPWGLHRSPLQGPDSTLGEL